MSVSFRPSSSYLPSFFSKESREELGYCLDKTTSISLAASERWKAGTWKQAFLLRNPGPLLWTRYLFLFFLCV